MAWSCHAMRWPTAALLASSVTIAIAGSESSRSTRVSTRTSPWAPSDTSTHTSAQPVEVRSNTRTARLSSSSLATTTSMGTSSGRSGSDTNWTRPPSDGPALALALALARVGVGVGALALARVGVPVR